MLVSFGQREKTPILKLVKSEGNCTADKDEQPSNANPPIVNTVSGNDIFSRLLQYVNDSGIISVTPYGTEYDVPSFNAG